MKKAELIADDPAFSRVMAISQYQSVFDAFLVLDLPIEYAQAHANLASALVIHATDPEQESTELYLMRAVSSYEIAVSTFNEAQFADKCASIQANLGRIFVIHSQLNRIDSAESDLDQAKKHIEKALEIYRLNGPAEMVDWCLESLSKIEKLRSKPSKQTRL
jgi:hypothetical protein